MKCIFINQSHRNKSFWTHFKKSPHFVTPYLIPAHTVKVQMSMYPYGKGEQSFYILV